MSVLDGLAPAPVLAHFARLFAIPHGSGRTREISDACLQLARPHCRRAQQDERGNLIFWKDATPGREGRPPLLLQAHLDMVLAKDEGCPLDLTREGLQLQVEGDWLSARGTTLGGDDGAGVALCLAVLTTPGLCHPPLEVVLTVDEEIGMLGAAALEMGALSARRMINLDAEEEGLLLAGCAGGSTLTARLPLMRREVAPGPGFLLSLTGLAGGHSGTEIHRGRGNAIRLLGQALGQMAERLPLSLSTVDGGGADNAIPQSARATFSLPPGAEEELTQAVQQIGAQLRRVWEGEAGLTLTLTPLARLPHPPLREEAQRRVLFALTQAPDGVMRLERQLEGRVETSLNLGVAACQEGALTLRHCLRSSSDEARRALARRLDQFYRYLGGAGVEGGAYPAWPYRPDSPLRETLSRVYTQQTGRPLRVETLHAGLECGLFARALPGLDCVACGPDIRDIHTPREKMSLSSLQRIWRWLTAALAQL